MKIGKCKIVGLAFKIMLCVCLFSGNMTVLNAEESEDTIDESALIETETEEIPEDGELLTDEINSDDTDAEETNETAQDIEELSIEETPLENEISDVQDPEEDAADDPAELEDPEISEDELILDIAEDSLEVTDNPDQDEIEQEESLEAALSDNSEKTEKVSSAPIGSYAYASFTDANELVFFRSYTDYDEDVDIISDTAGNTYSGRIFKHIEELELKNGDEQPWYTIKRKITSVRVADYQKIYPISMNYWFHGFGALTEIDLSGFDTSDMTSARGLFMNCYRLDNPNVDLLLNSDVTDIGGLFAGCTGLKEIHFGNIDTSNVVNMSSLFNGCSQLTELDLSAFDTRKVESMRYLFSGCTNLKEVNLSSFNTYNVTNMERMFENCKKLLSIDLSGFDTRNVNMMSYMFYSCSSLTELDVSGFDTSNVGSFEAVFSGCSNLRHLDVSHFDTSSAISFGGMFSYCDSLVSLDLSSFNTSNASGFGGGLNSCNNLMSVTLGSRISDCGVGPLLPKGMWTNDYANQTLTETELYEKFPMYASDYAGTWYCWEEGSAGYAVLEDDGDLVFFRSDESYPNNSIYTGITVNGTELGGTVYSGFERTGIYSWSSQAGRIKRVYSADQKVFHLSNLKSVFSGCSAMSSIDISYFNTSEVTDMQYAFSNCKSIQSLDLRSFDTADVTKMNHMFYYCIKLTELNVSSFNTSSVDDMDSMFSNCRSIEQLDIRNFDTSNVTKMCKMFETCEKLTSLDVSGFETRKVTTMERMFYGCSSLEELDASLFYTPALYNMGSMFSGCKKLRKLRVDDLYTSGVSSMANVFENCSSLEELDLSNFDTSNVKQMSYMFDGCSSLKALDLKEFNTENVINMPNMFHGCSSLETLNISSFKTYNVTNMNAMFSGCASLEELNILPLDTRKVTTMAGMFSNCTSLKSLDLSGFSTESVSASGMISLFSGCSTLSQLDVSRFNTSKVTTFASMFTNCSSLESLDVSAFDTSHTTSLQRMFEGCSGLKELDLSGFVTDQVTTMEGMFSDCEGLEFLQIDSFNTSKVTSFQYMFQDCQSLESLDLSHFNTDNATQMFSMFNTCNKLSELDISSFNTSKVTNMNMMFSACSALRLVKLGEGFTKWISNGYLPEGPWVNKELDLMLTESELGKQYPENASLWAGTWERIPVVNPTVIILDKTEMTMQVNEVYQLTAVLEPENTTEREIRWKSNSSYIASVDNEGNVTANHPGEAIITASGANFVSARCIVNVVEAQHEHQYGEPTYTWSEDHMTVTASVTCSECSEVTEETVTSIYEVIEEATVGHAGKGRYTAIFTNDLFTTQTCDVDIPALPDTEPKTIELNLSNLTMQSNHTTVLQATVTPAEAADAPITWSSSRPDIASVDENGHVTSYFSGVAVITAETQNGLQATCKVIVQFSDVQDTSLFYYDYVYGMLEREVVGGYADGTFRPTANCNRAAVVTFLWRLKGKPEPSKMATFKDMTGNSDFDKAISWAAENNITTGWEADNTFRPWNTCNRAAVMTFLWRAAGKPAPTKMAEFTDMTGNKDFDTAISWASEKGITTGWADGTFRPWNTCNRLAVVSFLARYDALKSN